MQLATVYGLSDGPRCAIDARRQISGTHKVYQFRVLRFWPKIWKLDTVVGKMFDLE